MNRIRTYFDSNKMPRRDFLKSSALGVYTLTFGIPLVACGGGSSSGSAAVSTGPAPPPAPTVYLATGSFGTLQTQYASSTLTLVQPNGASLTADLGLGFDARPFSLLASALDILIPSAQAATTPVTKLSFLRGAEVAPDGSFWVAYANGLAHYTSNLQLISSLTSINGVPIAINGNIALLPDGRIAFTDYKNGKLGMVTPSGTATWIGESFYNSNQGYKTKRSTFGLPKAVALNGDGNLAVLDEVAKRIVIFNTSGTDLSAISLTSKAPRSLTYGDGYYYVADAVSQSVTKILASNPSQTSQVALTKKTPYKVIYGNGAVKISYFN